MKGSKTSCLFGIVAIALSTVLFSGNNLANAKSKGCKPAMGREMYIGADYYPEHWPKERWETDIRLMKGAGFNIVRLAEFSWINMEPVEGRFKFTWLDEVLELLTNKKTKDTIRLDTFDAAVIKL